MLFQDLYKKLQRQIENIVKHLTWSFFLKIVNGLLLALNKGKFTKGKNYES